MHGAGRGSLLHGAGASLDGAGRSADDVDLVDGLMDDDLGVHDLLFAAGSCGSEDAFAGAELIESGLGFFGAGLGAFELALELLDAHDVGVGDGLLLLKLALVHLDLLVEFVERLLEDDDVLAVLLGLEDQLLDGPLLLV